jgi:predicted metalloprotease with PDZ domain
MGQTGQASQPQVLAPAPTELATVDPTVTPSVTGTQWITTVIVEYAPDVLGVVVDEKLQVIHIEVDSPAEKAGLQVGDMLESLAGISFVTEREKVRAKILEPNLDPTQHRTLKLIFARGKQMIAVDVTLTPPNPQPVEGTGTPVWPPQDYF